MREPATLEHEHNHQLDIDVASQINLTLLSTYMIINLSLLSTYRVSGVAARAEARVLQGVVVRRHLVQFTSNPRGYEAQPKKPHLRVPVPGFQPLSSKYGTYKTVKARFWPQLPSRSACAPGGRGTAPPGTGYEEYQRLWGST